MTAILAVTGTPGATVLHCPLPSCEWTHEVTPLPVESSPGALADVFGWGVMAAHATAERLQSTERALSEHLNGHRAEEWVPEMMRLRDRVTELEAAAGGES